MCKMTHWATFDTYPLYNFLMVNVSGLAPPTFFHGDKLVMMGERTQSSLWGQIHFYAICDINVVFSRHSMKYILSLIL